MLATAFLLPRIRRAWATLARPRARAPLASHLGAAVDWRP